MRQVTQTILANDPSERPANCLQAAVASALDLDLEAVPHFTETIDSRGYLLSWCALRGWSVTRRPELYGVMLGIAAGPSPRGYYHAVAVQDGRIAWDPHPSRAGINGAQEVWELSRADPADPAHQRVLDAAPEHIAWILRQPPVRYPYTPADRDGAPSTAEVR